MEIFWFLPAEELIDLNLSPYHVIVDKSTAYSYIILNT